VYKGKIKELGPLNFVHLLKIYHPLKMLEYSQKMEHKEKRLLFLLAKY